MGEITLEKISRHVEDKEDIRSSHGFIEGKSCWPAGLKDGWQARGAVGIACLNAADL